MSFEGYYQKLCKNGHDCSHDVYYDVEKCSICGASIVWENLVDQTNDAGHPEELKIREQVICAHCNTTLSTTYFIPGEKVKRKKVRKVEDGIYLK